MVARGLAGDRAPGAERLVVAEGLRLLRPGRADCDAGACQPRRVVRGREAGAELRGELDLAGAEAQRVGARRGGDAAEAGGDDLGPPQAEAAEHAGAARMRVAPEDHVEVAGGPRDERPVGRRRPERHRAHARGRIAAEVVLVDGGRERQERVEGDAVLVRRTIAATSARGPHARSSAARSRRCPLTARRGGPPAATTAAATDSRCARSRARATRGDNVSEASPRRPARCRRRRRPSRGSRAGRAGPA